MFKSISFKIAMLFVLLTVSIIVLIGTFMVNSTDGFYHDDFKNLMDLVFSDDYSKQLENSVIAEQPAEDIYNTVFAYSTQLGIDAFRNIYLLDGKTGRVINGLTTDMTADGNIEKSENILTAMSGEKGDRLNTAGSYMDYAHPISDGNQVRYIVYVRDTKEETNTILQKIFSIMWQAMLLGFGISILFSILLSKTITSPIDSLTVKAMSIASGDFDTRLDVKSDDEIGVLTNTFNEMAQELKSTLSKIENEKNKVETILRYLNDGIVAFDTNGNVIHMNPAAKRIMKLKSEEVTFNDLFGDCDISITQISFFDNDQSIEKQMTIDDTELSIYLAPFKGENKTAGIIAVVQDVTKQRRLENARREFVANVSHELRTPITTIKSYTETLLNSVEDNDYDEKMFERFLSIINKESDRMTRLVKDLLLLSSLDNGIKNMKTEEFDLNEMLVNICEKLQHTARQKQQTLEYCPSNRLPQFTGNPDRIEQVITNIITNAVKYTQQGGYVSVSSMYVYESIVIKVKDNGIGIPKENLEHIFERFYRVDKARSRDQGGTGLGLAIAKEIVEAHSGDISITSTPGKGSEVIITLPVTKKQKDKI